MDKAAFARELQQHLGDQDPEYLGCEVVDLRRVTGGISRDSAQLTVKLASGVAKELFLQRDPPGGSTLGEIDRRVEWDTLRFLQSDGDVVAPTPVCFIEDSTGAATLVCEAIQAPEGSEPLRAEGQQKRLEATALVAGVAAAVHSVDTSRLPESLPSPASWHSYMDSQIAQWSAAEHSYPGSDPFMRFMGAWLEANRPAEAPLRMLHGDFQLSNIIVPETGRYALLDWELAHVGDPREDLGWFQVVAALNPPDLINANPDAFFGRYRELTGLPESIINPASVAYFSILSTLKVFTGIQARAAALSEGPMPVAVPYTVLVQSHIHRMWMSAVAGLEAVTP